MSPFDLFVLLTSVLLFAAAGPAVASAHSNETSFGTSERNNAAAKGLHGFHAANGRVQEERGVSLETASDVVLDVAKSQVMTGIAEKLEKVKTIDGAFNEMKLQDKVAKTKPDMDYSSLARDLFGTNDFLDVYDRVHSLHPEHTNAMIVDHLQVRFGLKPLAMLLRQAKQLVDGKAKNIVVELEKAQFAKWLNVPSSDEAVAKVYFGIDLSKDLGSENAVEKDIIAAYSKYAEKQKLKVTN
ncbi:unnamed protein product [Hyaloperonospora brassicae]|uniref:RxLR effector protein n=1 Tax=Hyaloperonospora brassicae TaxID=162125 RepID=A0AAV0UUD2_HYABA|nr:unnamed protein product [Hyaloperonospora brassicae]